MEYFSPTIVFLEKAPRATTFEEEFSITETSALAKVAYSGGQFQGADNSYTCVKKCDASGAPENGGAGTCNAQLLMGSR